MKPTTTAVWISLTLLSVYKVKGAMVEMQEKCAEVYLPEKSDYPKYAMDKMASEENVAQMVNDVIPAQSDSDSESVHEPIEEAPKASDEENEESNGILNRLARGIGYWLTPDGQMMLDRMESYKPPRPMKFVYWGMKTSADRYTHWSKDLKDYLNSLEVSDDEDYDWDEYGEAEKQLDPDMLIVKIRHYDIYGSGSYEGMSEDTYHLGTELLRAAIESGDLERFKKILSKRRYKKELHREYTIKQIFKYTLETLLDEKNADWKYEIMDILLAREDFLKCYFSDDLRNGLISVFDDQKALDIFMKHDPEFINKMNSQFSGVVNSLIFYGKFDSAIRALEAGCAHDQLFAGKNSLDLALSCDQTAKNIKEGLKPYYNAAQLEKDRLKEGKRQELIKILREKYGLVESQKK